MAQAEALAAAMVDVAASHGYAGASVAKVLERAGVSRQTFYNHYSSREDCYLAAYRRAAAEVGEHFRAAVRDSGPGERPEATLAALLCAVEARPAAARVLLVDALGGSTAVRAEQERQLAGIERAIDRFLQSADAPDLQAPGIALLGGVCGVLAPRLVRGETPVATELLPDLLAWVSSYRCPHTPHEPPAEELWRDLGLLVGGKRERARVSEVQLLPRGPNALPPDAAGSLRRSRILAATIRQTAARGYAELTVADIVAEARIPRAAFYAHFANKQEAFLEAQVQELRESIAAAAAEFATGRTWPEQVWRGLAALLGYVAGHPDAAQLGFVEIHAAGGAAVARDEENRHAYMLFLADGYRQTPQAASLPPICSEAIAGAIEAILRRYVVRGETERAREALPQCAYVALAPFIGSEAALSWVSDRARGAG